MKKRGHVAWTAFSLKKKHIAHLTIAVDDLAIIKITHLLTNMQPINMLKTITLCSSRIDLEMDFEKKKKKKSIFLVDAGLNLHLTRTGG